MRREFFIIILILTTVCLSSCIDVENPDDNYVDSAIKSGTTAPDFSLEKAEGGWISLGDYKNKSNVVLVFHKGST